MNSPDIKILMVEIGKKAKISAEVLACSDPMEKQQALEQWLRRVPDDPGGLIRRKFRYESIQKLRSGDEPDDDVRW